MEIFGIYYYWINGMRQQKIVSDLHTILDTYDERQKVREK